MSAAQCGAREDTMAVKRPKTHFLIGYIGDMLDALKRAWHGGSAGGSVSGTSAAGAAHTHTFTGTAPTTATAEAFTGTGFATSGQTVTTTSTHTMTLNQCAGMWLITASQAPCLITGNTAVVGAQAVLTVYGLAPSTNAETYKILKLPTPAGSNANESSHTHGAGSFAAAPASSAVHYDAGEYTIAVANASSLLTSIALCKALVTAYTFHVTDRYAHRVNDETNVLSYTEHDIVDLPSVLLAANELKASYNAHRAESGVHATDDSAHEVTASDATIQSEANTLLNAIKTAFNAHIADGMAPQSWRTDNA
jgi:hypothetical protein